MPDRVVKLETVDLDQGDSSERLLDRGDMALILKRDGTVRLYSIGTPSLNDEQSVADKRTDAIMLSKVKALAFAALSEPIMTKLVEMTVAPEAADSTVN